MLATLLAQKRFVHFVVPLCHCFCTVLTPHVWLQKLDNYVSQYLPLFLLASIVLMCRSPVYKDSHCYCEVVFLLQRSWHVCLVLNGAFDRNVSCGVFFTCPWDGVPQMEVT